MKNTERAWVEIDLDAIAHNLNQIKHFLNPDTKLIGVVKADAYGHGIVEVSKTALQNGVAILAVAFIDEAVQLRKSGITAPVLLLGSTSDADIDQLFTYNITPTVFTEEFAKKLSQRAAALKTPAKIHIKVDTGMHRIGFLYENAEEEHQNTVDKILKISQLPYIEVEGLFTHLSTSDKKDTAYTLNQLNRFKELKDELLSKGLKIPICHAANSAALVRFSEFRLDAVRAGIIMYGMYPSDEVSFQNLNLRPAMTFKARIVDIKTLSAGCDIGYGRSYTTSAPAKIATASVGYADGYSRLLSDKTKVLVGGQLVPQVGKICMDLCMIDVTTVNNINIGDEVTLFGSSEQGGIPVEDIALAMGTINYEVACMISKRIPRIYIKNGKPIKSINYLLPEETV
ncbi:MAG: alanine racemase [Clostridia bacterium]|nr:alanine racemase [Clostridia bacterium]